jgi:sugar transferase (PEP-CTERM/EpsH1 system associated)
MNILFVTPRLPYPPLKGDQCIPYYRLKLLGKKHNITLLTFYQHDKELDYLKELKPFCKEIATVKLNKLCSFFNMLIGGIFSKLPFQVLYFRSEAFRESAQSLIKNRRFDIVHTYMLRMAEYTKDLNGPKVLDLIDLMQLNLKKRITIGGFFEKIFFKKELKRITRYENQMITKYDASILVSDNDKNHVESDRIAAISLGIDTHIFKRHSNLPDNKIIIFSGNMGYFPNESAVIWFLEKCFGRIKREIPDVKLVIAGNNPGSKIKKMGDNISVFVTGFVESMVSELNKAQIAIAPMQSGYGMHIKILEAMACALPVVTTTSGLGAIKAAHEKNVIIADDASDFTRSCVKLLNNYQLAKKIGDDARDLVLKNYSWEMHANKMEKIYSTFIEHKGCDCVNV